MGPAPPRPVAADGTFTRVDVGAPGAVFALRASGEVWSWGTNAWDVLGRGDVSDPFLAPGVVTALAGEKVVRAGGVAPLYYQGIGWAITEAGQLLTWGASTVMVTYPGAVPIASSGLERVTSVAASMNHVCAVADGYLHCWGDGLLACTGSADPARAPVKLRPQGRGRAQQVSVAYSNTCVRLDDGSVECCGVDDWGQLGRAPEDGGVPTARARILTKASAFTGHAVSVAAGYRSTCALVQGGTVQCWGSNEFGQLGQGSFDKDRHPTPATVTFE